MSISHLILFRVLSGLILFIKKNRGREFLLKGSVNRDKSYSKRFLVVYLTFGETIDKTSSTNNLQKSFTPTMGFQDQKSKLPND